MPQIQTLINDIYKTIGVKDGWFTEEIASVLGTSISVALRQQLGSKRQEGRLRLSGMGSKCPRALWYSVHNPELAERLPPYAEIKYAYGHIIEALALSLARAAGHSVTGEQDELIVDGIIGHRDAVIDGCLVDVKSTSTLGFKKFKERTLENDDPFGYLSQLDGYLLGSAGDDLVTCKELGYILAIDKTLGHMCLYEHRLRETHIRERISACKAIVALSEPPECECRSVADGKSGNYRLDTKASYSPFKYACNPRLRTFLYASGPVYLTEVVRKPDVIEVDKYGKVVYN